MATSTRLRLRRLRDEAPAQLLSARPSEHALTASATRVTRRTGSDLARLTQPWQLKALQHYDEIGEIKYAAQFYARPLSKLKLYIGERMPDDSVKRVNNPAAQDALDRVHDPSGGHSQILDAYGRLQFLIGDGYLVQDRDDDGQEVWEFLSPTELRLQGGDTYYRVRAPSVVIESGTIDDRPLGEADLTEIRAWRFYRRHPAYSWLADAPMQGVLDICQQLLMLDKTERARALQRLILAGILIIDERVTLKEFDQEVADEDMKDDPLLNEIIEHMMTPAVRQGTAADMVPYMLRADPGAAGKVADMIFHLKLGDSSDTHPEDEARKAKVERLSYGLDMPPEALTGISDTNHWGAWMVNDETWSAHQEPVAVRFCEDLTSAYLHPILREENEPDYERLIVWYDASAVIVHPDRGKDADAVFDRGELNGGALREAHGFTERDAPSEAERELYLTIKVRDPVLAEAVFGEEKVSPTGGGLDKEAPPVQPDATVASVAPHTNGRHDKILGAAEFTVSRARAKAGAKLRTRARDCGECLDLIGEVADLNVAATLGRETVGTLKIASIPALVDGVAEEFAATVTRFGLSLTAGQKLGEAIEQYAASRLFDLEPEPLPEGFADYIARLDGAA